jgi:hypothetical protein
MKTTVNTNIKIPKKIMECLTLFETYCVIKNIQETNKDEVRSFIKEYYDEKLANKFKSKYLY